MHLSVVWSFSSFSKIIIDDVRDSERERESNREEEKAAQRIK